mgnify:CR=1 FL=1
MGPYCGLQKPSTLMYYPGFSGARSSASGLLASWPMDGAAEDNPPNSLPLGRTELDGRLRYDVVDDLQPSRAPCSGGCSSRPLLYRLICGYHSWCAPTPVASCSVDDVPIDLSGLLTPGCWIGDDVLNAFLSIVQRGCRGRVLMWNTYFLSILGGMDCDSFHYQRVRRWTEPQKLVERAGIERVADAEFVCVPVHAGGKHWWLAVCDLRKFSRPVLWCMDSARDERTAWDASCGEKALNCLAKWLFEENVTGAPLLVLSPSFAPQRDPNFAGDCGIFTCAAADRVAACGLEAGFPYSSANMRSLRRRIAQCLVDSRYDMVARIKASHSFDDWQCGSWPSTLFNSLVARSPSSL